MNDTEPTQLTPEQRLEQVCERIEHATKRLQIGDHMIALLEHDNSMCLYAIRGLAKKLEAQEVEDELAAYIHKRAGLLQELHGALRELGGNGTILPPPNSHG